MRKYESTPNITEPTAGESTAAVEAPEQPKLRFPEDPDQYTEEELRADPEKRFRVNPKDFPIFSQQAEMGPNWGDKAENLPLDVTMSRYVTETADTVAVLAGESEKDRELPPTDLVVYLDKSARPVSFLVNEFWTTFTNQKRPKSTFLAIDRVRWLHYLGVDVDEDGQIRDEVEGKRPATINDVPKEKITKEDIARIRALFIPGGIEEENPDAIMETSTGLEGKNITIIDEVERSGTTMELAKYLVQLAIPEAHIHGHAFWHPGFQRETFPGGVTKKQMRGTPIWYDTKTSVGRAIGDINEEFFEERHERYNTARTRAQKYGAFALGEFINLHNEPHNNRSLRIAEEIQKIFKEFKAGHILMLPTQHYDTDKMIDSLESLGIQFMPNQDKPPKNSYQYVKNAIAKREAEQPRAI